MTDKYERIKQLFIKKHIAYEFAPTKYLINSRVGRKGVFSTVSDEIIELDMIGDKIAVLLGFGGFAVFWFILNITTVKCTIEGATFTFIPIILLSLPCLWVMPNYRKVCIINRMEGTITISLPRTFETYWLKKPPTVTIGFMDATFDMFAMQAGKPGFLNIRTPDGNRSMGIPPLFDNALQLFSFLTWYMDKNRPLPQGEIFDLYREKDYQRRKTEGFLDPMFISLIPTPENTEEREYERLEREYKFFKQIERDLIQFKQEDPTGFKEFIEQSNTLSTNIVHEKIKNFVRNK